MTVSYDLLHPLPSKSFDGKDWFAWKNRVLTESMGLFRERHPWFNFKKQDIFSNLGNSCNVPRLLLRLARGSDMQVALDFLKGHENVVFKKTVGHSSKDVRLLNLNSSTNEYDCFLAKSKVSISALQEWVNASECIFEESLFTFEEPIPFDFKCYLIDGKVKYVVVFNRNALRPIMLYFDAVSIRPIPLAEIFSSIPSIWIEGSGPVSEELIQRIKIAKAEAERIARENLQVKGIIVALDMYVTPLSNGYKVWLGEITPRPGVLYSNWLRKNFVLELFGLDKQLS